VGPQEGAGAGECSLALVEKSPKGRLPDKRDPSRRHPGRQEASVGGQGVVDSGRIRTLGREFAGRDAITQVASFCALGNEFSDEGVQLLMGLVTCSPWCRSAAVGGSLADMGLRAALGGVTIGVVARVTRLLRANSETDRPACVILAGAGWERLGEGSGDGVIGCRARW
jgi:hypothetical protein